MFKRAPKIYNNLKSDYPENTIRKIENGFKKIGLDLIYRPRNEFPFFSGRVEIASTPFGANGKGISPILAKASAYAELSERFSSGHFFNFFPLKNHLLQNRKFLLRTDKSLLSDFIHYRFLKTYENGFYYNIKNRVNIYDFLKKYKKTYLDSYLKNDLFLDWVSAYSVNRKQYVKVPINFIRRISGSNGLAAGNSIEEAFVQGTCEIFERYCLLKILKNKLEVPTIDVRTIKDEKIELYLKYFELLNIDVIIKDFSLGNKIPVIGVIFINNNIKNSKNKLKRDLYFIRIRAASSLNIKEALNRCFQEEIQGISLFEYMRRKSCDYYWDLFLREGVRYKNPSNPYSYLLRNYDFFGDLDFLKTKNNSIDFRDIKSYENNDFYEDINIIIEICEKLKWEILLINLTHPIINFPTVRVIIPSVSDTLGFRLKEVEIEKVINYKSWFNLLTIEHLFEVITSFNWIEKNENAFKFMASIEDYLESNLNRPILLLNSYGFENISTLEMLAILCNKLKIKNKARKYWGLHERLTINKSGRFKKKISFEELILVGKNNNGQNIFNDKMIKELRISFNSILKSFFNSIDNLN